MKKTLVLTMLSILSYSLGVQSQVELFGRKYSIYYYFDKDDSKDKPKPEYSSVDMKIYKSCGILYWDSMCYRLNSADRAFATAKKVKETKDYIIGKEDSGNYHFYDIKGKNLYLIKYLDQEDTYKIEVYSDEQYAEVTQNMMNIRGILGKTRNQRKAIEYLVGQTKEW